MEFDYPINYELYTYQEITIIINFLDIIEKCYSKNGIDVYTFKNSYKDFKNIVKTKSEENDILKKYKHITKFDGYLCIKEMKKEKIERIKF